jgi:twitching motility protein PilT
MENIIKAAVERGASDIHIKAGDVFRARIDGKLVPLTKQRLTPDQTKAIAAKLVPVEADRRQLDQIRDYDCSWGSAGIGRFRVNILRQRSSFMVVMRVIPFEVPSIERLGLPAVLHHIAEMERGIILVSGATGSGKSSTMAALVNHINQTMNRHIVTLENPIEFLHRDLNSSVTQREVGPDTQSFAVGLRAALRQDPDVVLLDEMNDVENLDLALTAAETGHLLISTLHTPDAMSTVARIVGMFASEEQEVARVRLADALQAVVAQRLLPRADGGGRCAAVEVLIGTPEIRECVRDRNRVGEIRDVIEAWQEEHGMQSMEQHLALLVADGTVTFETARGAALDPDHFEELLEAMLEDGGEEEDEEPADPRKRGGAGSSKAKGKKKAKSEGGGEEEKE